MIEQPQTSRMPVCRLLGAALLALFVVQCSAYQIKGQGEQPLILESQGENCRVVQKKGLYSLLFGAVPLNPVEPEDLFPKNADSEKESSGVSYRITDEVTTLDAVVSIVAGWALSLNRRTIQVEACEENVRVANPQAEQRELDRILAGYAQRSRAPIVILNSGESHQGRIIEFTETEVVIEVRNESSDEEKSGEESETTDSKTSGKDESSSGEETAGPAAPINYVDLIELKNGRRIKGKVTSQNRERIVVQIGENSEEILKSNIKRVRYRVPENEAPDTDAKPELETIRIARTDIRKIVLQ